MLFALHMSEAVRGIDKGAFFLNIVLLLYFKYCIKIHFSAEYFCSVFLQLV